MEGSSEQPPPKRMRIFNEHEYGAGDGVGDGARPEANETANWQLAQDDGRDLPYFKPGLPEPYDKGENDCFFEGCVTRASGSSYFMQVSVVFFSHRVHSFPNQDTNMVFSKGDIL